MNIARFHKLILLFAAVAVAYQAFGQETDIFQGRLKSLSNTAQPFGECGLQKAGDEIMVKASASDDKGAYMVENCMVAEVVVLKCQFSSSHYLWVPEYKKPKYVMVDTYRDQDGVRRLGIEYPFVANNLDEVAQHPYCKRSETQSAAATTQQPDGQASAAR